MKRTPLTTVWLTAVMASSALAQDVDQGEVDARTLEQLELFADVFARIRDEYVEDTQDAELIEDALNGALSSLDPHSSYVPPQQFTELRQEAKREYGGLGIEVSLDNGLVRVNYATPDAPAARAGIKSGDYVTHVEGDSVLGKTLDDAVSGMRGLAGDPITVTILSEGQEARDVTLVREVVVGRAVRHRVEDGMGYIFVETFNNDRLTDDIVTAMEDLKRELGGTLPGLVIDLRGNRGGLLDQSVSVSGLFLDGGEVLSACGREISDTERYNAEEGELYPGMPIVVLINSGSASAAEIVAGALQDRGRAVVVGRRSFGKGSVQSVIDLGPRGALRMTTQRYFTPSGKSIQGRGILPDILVAAQTDSGEIRKRFREDNLPNFLANLDGETNYQERYEDVDYPPKGWPRTQDYQLKKAVEILKSQPRYGDILERQASR